MRDDFRSDGEMWNIEHICVENIGMPHTGISKYFAHNNTFKNVLVIGWASLLKQISFYIVLFKNSWFLLNKNPPWKNLRCFKPHILGRNGVGYRSFGLGYLVRQHHRKLIAQLNWFGPDQISWNSACWSEGLEKPPFLEGFCMFSCYGNRQIQKAIGFTTL